MQLDWRTTLSLAFQSIGVIYGDIGTSPLYVYSSTFTSGIKNNNDILGVLSLIIYTIALVPMVKYVFVVLWANDNGDGGTFALYSLICRYAKASLMPNQQPEDRELSHYRLDTPSNQLRRAQKIREKLENSKVAQMVLFIVTILGTSMVIGDGVLTPCISGELHHWNLTLNYHVSHYSDAVVGISVAILILLFSAQRFGTDKVGSAFAPIILLWFTFISGIGLYNLFKHDVTVLRAFNPKYIIDYFQRNGKQAWVSLGGIVLCITGTEAMFADIGHFSVRAVQISFSGIVFPALLCAYSGQAAYLTQFNDHVADTFYKSIPKPLYWPTFVVAVSAAIIASQAMISGAFAIISQSLSLGCFPRVKVVHTSAKYEGQVYIPEINYMLMIACVIVTVAFRTTEQIGNAYGTVVLYIEIKLVFKIEGEAQLHWHCSGCCDGHHNIYGYTHNAFLYKFKQGGYLPLAFALVLMMIMGIWHYVHKQRYMFELKNKVSSEFIRDLALNPDINRVPGIGLLYSELVQGIPPIFPHFIANIPSIHSVLVFVSIKSIPISKVAAEERFLFRLVEPREYRMFRCVVRYGYNDVICKPQEFEQELVENLKEFIRHETFILEGGTTEQTIDNQLEAASLPHSGLLVKDGNVRRPGSSRIQSEESILQNNQPRVSSGNINPVPANRSANSSSRIISRPIQGVDEEVQFIQKAMDTGAVYLLGETEVVAEENSSILKQIVVNYVYSFLRKNFREADKVLSIPQGKILRVGMTYEI
ncbi:potassium transporter [Macleaya cordata]|uniref:Potassium transporter n=1 Tax=Macleaya cordata TaxID=56857 RepID=A0A200R3P1_MACCD|nr:potassium transporter [Macleaya cordata]